MNKKLLYLIGIGITILIGTYFYWLLCCKACEEEAANNQVTKEIKELTTPKQKPATYNAFVVNDVDGKKIINTSDNFNFEASGLQFIKPVTAVLDTEISNLKEYLSVNADKTITIEGFYTSSETNASAFPNLGLARANAVKNYFVSKGISSAIVNTSGTLNDDLVADSLQVFHGPLAFTLLQKKDNSDAINQLTQELKDNPLILNFKTGQANINLTNEQREYFAKIARYLDKVPEGKINVTGHTDSQGDADLNLKLGLDRANFAKNYLIKNATIPADKIAVFSKGEAEPIADNSTSEGQAKNRRTVISIK